MLSIASKNGVIDPDRVGNNMSYPALWEISHHYAHAPDPTHELYGYYYKEDFISILEDVTNKSLGREGYETLFWVGLDKTEAWRRLPKEKQERYKQQLASYLIQ